MWTLFISFTLPLFVERRVHFDVGVLLFEPIKDVACIHSTLMCIFYQQRKKEKNCIRKNSEPYPTKVDSESMLK